MRGPVFLARPTLRCGAPIGSEGQVVLVVAGESAGSPRAVEDQEGVGEPVQHGTIVGDQEDAAREGSQVVLELPDG